MATKSVIGTEDDETFYLPQLERKRKAQEYYKANRAHINAQHRWYKQQSKKKK